MAHPVVHWEIGGRSGDKLQAFYGDLFDWSVEDTGQDYWLVAPAGEGGIGGGIMQVVGEIPPYVTIYVRVEDLGAALSRAEELGGRTVKPPTPITGMGSFALLEDPEGNVVGLLGP